MGTNNEGNKLDYLEIVWNQISKEVSRVLLLGVMFFLYHRYWSKFCYWN